MSAAACSLVNQTTPTAAFIHDHLVYPKVNKRCGGSGLVHETRPRVGDLAPAVSSSRLKTVAHYAETKKALVS